MHAVHVVVAILVVTLIVGLLAWGYVAVIRRNRRLLAEHPEKSPFGWNLVFRISPFVALLIAASVYMGTQRGWGWYVFGAVGVLCFAYEIAKRWHPPKANHA